MTHHALTLGPARLHALCSGALYWPDQGLLVVSDLHFGKSERLARRGGSLLPPYENRATLQRRDFDIGATNARLPGRTAPCFLIDQARVIMPAYGAYTGGLWCDHPDLLAVMHPTALAILTGPRCLAIPMR